MFEYVQLKHSSGFNLDWMVRKDDANQAYMGRRPFEEAGNYTRKLTTFGSFIIRFGLAVTLFVVAGGTIATFLH
ncbi:MAG: hypothetical protein HY918_03535 [Candidatus Doudnabacteria bacterium]|nr:hypothetical protein [Candidatus Doudnabacteria bacterium]